MDAASALTDLLRQLFSPTELNLFLRETEIASVPLSELLDHVPANPTPAAHMRLVSDGLLRRGLIGAALFDQLREARPQRADLITACEQLGTPPPMSIAPLPGAAQEAKNPYRPFALFVGRQGLLSELCGHLTSDISVLLIGGRRAGKTALIRQLGPARLPGRRLFADTVGEWHLGSEAAACASLARRLGASASSREAITERLQQLAPLTVVLDEADRLLQTPWRDSFLAWLRTLDEASHIAGVSFLLAGSPALNAYRNPTDGGSPVFNYAERVFLAPLSRAARREMLAPLSEPVNESVLFNAAGGHPWLLAQVLGHVWSRAGLEEALDRVFSRRMSDLLVWRDQLDAQSRALLAMIPPEGLPLSAFRYDGSLRHLAGARLTLQCLCLIEAEKTRLYIGPGLVTPLLLGA